MLKRIGLHRVVYGLLAVLLLAATPAQAKTPPVCTGVNIVEELAAKNDPMLKTALAGEKEFANDGAMLWRITKDGAAPSYLFGTIHITDPTVTKLPPELVDVFSKIKQVAVEVRSDEAEAEMGALMVQQPGLFFFGAGAGLGAHFSDAEIEKLTRVLDQPQLPVRRMRPWMLSLMMAYSPCERRRVEASIPVLDEVIERRGKEAGLSIHSLETVESQASALSSIPVADQAAMLKVDMTTYKRSNDFAATMRELYLQRRIALVWTLNLAFADRLGVPRERFQSFRRAMLDQRNATMLKASVKLMENGPTLIAVGALHLIGDQGLVRLFRQAGYTVEAMDGPASRAQ
ncbi:MAG: TraB/GumN family protein [Pseudomonadota bacterium]